MTALKKYLALAVAFTLSIAIAYGIGRYQTSHPVCLDKTEVYFSPHGGCTEAILDQIGKSKHQILVQAYSFTSPQIARALLEAHKRNVKVEVILDKGQRSQSYSSPTFLHNSGIPTCIDSAHAIAHNKVIIIDGKIVITGSFNFTKAAEEKNSENLLIIESEELAKKYIQNWNNHRGHSEVYTPKY